VMKLTVQTKNLDLVESGEEPLLNTQPVDICLEHFERKCSAAFVRKMAWCRGHMCLEDPSRLSHDPNRANVSILLSTWRSNPGLVVSAMTTVTFLAIVPISVRAFFGKAIYGGDTFEDHWICFTYIILIVCHGFWPVLLACIWFRKFSFIIFKFAALTALVRCSKGEIFGLDFFVELDTPWNIAALMVFRERLFRQSVKELRYLPPESLLTYLITISAVLTLFVLTDLLRGSNHTDIDLGPLRVRLSEAVPVTVCVTLCAFAFTYVVATLLNAAQANALINNGIIQAFQDEQQMRTRDRCLSPSKGSLKYNKNLRDTADPKATTMIDISIKNIESSHELIFTVYGVRITRVTMYSVGSSLGLLILSSAVGSLSKAVTEGAGNQVTNNA